MKTEVSVNGCTLKINDNFRTYIPETPEQRIAEMGLLLDMIIDDGEYRDPIVVWKEQNTVIGGHRRIELIPETTEHGIDPPRVVFKSFPDEVAVKTWMDNDQRARRNCDPQSLAIMKGRMVNTKAKETGSVKKAAQQIAAQTGDSVRTLEWNAAAERGVQAIEQVDQKAGKKLRTGKKRASQASLARAGKATKPARKKAAKATSAKAFNRALAEEQQHQADTRTRGEQMDECEFADNKVESFCQQLTKTLDDRFEICGLLHSDAHKRCLKSLKAFYKVWTNAREG